MESRPWQRHYDYNVPLTIRYPRIPLHDLIGIPANSYPDKPALNFYGTEMTFWELRCLVLRMANALGKLGVRKGDRVGMNLPNCPQYLIANYAALSLGADRGELKPDVHDPGTQTRSSEDRPDHSFHLRHGPSLYPRSLSGGGDSPSDRHQAHGLHNRSRSEH